MTKIKQLHPNNANGSQPLNIDLWEFHLYYQNMQPPLKFLLKNKLNKFYKNNGMRIETIASEIGKIQAEQFEMENGQIKMKEPLLNESGAPVNPNAEPLPLYKEGFNDTSFGEAFNRLMSLPTVIV